MEAWKTSGPLASARPRILTAAEMCRKDFADSAPDWARYLFEESKATTITVKRQRPISGGQMDARCLLVRVENKWLIATVPANFKGNELVGRAVRLDPTESRALIEQIRKAEPKAAATLLPIEFFAVEGSANDLRVRYSAAAMLGFFGLSGLLLGRYMCRGKRRVTLGVLL